MSLAKRKGERPVSVYVIEMRSTPFVKIGVAVDPVRRLEALQTGSPFPLRLAFAERVGSRLFAELVERICHQAFSERRARGEWFGVNPTCAASIIKAARDLGIAGEKKMQRPLSPDFFKRKSIRTGEPEF